jgi:ABC-type sugar transport system ATPase subunit
MLAKTHQKTGEPTGPTKANLDSALRCQMRYELARLKVQLNTTMIYVTHDQAEAMTLADKIVVMRDGIVEQVGSPLELYNSPVNTFVAQFMGSSKMNILPISFCNDTGKLSLFQYQTKEQLSFHRRKDLEYETDKKYYLGIRPEDIEVLRPDELFFGNKLDGVVSLSENLGGEGFIHVTLGDGFQITVKSKRNITEQIGSNVRLGFSIDNCYLFADDGKAIFGVD